LRWRGSWLITGSGGTINEAEFTAIKRAGYTDPQPVEVSLAVAIVTFTNAFNRINDTAVVAAAYSSASRNGPSESLDGFRAAPRVG
jgi:alkylhydroperoxidase family enzyme